MRPVWARLSPTEQAKEAMTKARGRRDAKRALQSAHDELAKTLVPKLSGLRDGGVIVDFATSWMLGEVVVHCSADKVETVHAELATFPELQDVTSDPVALRKRLRKL